MALYAFDGTWNEDDPKNKKDTNVVWFRNAYTGPKRYWEGVGTRFSVVGKVVGGLTGAGGHDRIREALVELTKNFLAGDRTVDIVGFSRGAAIAVDFANEVAKQTGLPGPSPATVRFLGVWDIVASFDIPGDNVDIGFDFKMPPTVQRCVHCKALDERRVFFPLTRLSGTGSNEAGRLKEVWFRGVHSDVGGGDQATGLSSIALNFMFAEALRAGSPSDPMPLDAATVNQNAARMNPDCPISLHPQHLLEQLVHFRKVEQTDLVHSSVSNRQDGGGRHHNNPPAGCPKIGDDGV